MSNIPAELRYTKSHEWLRVTPDGVGIVGITDHAQQELTDIVFVELPTLRDQVKADDACAVVESVKTASDIHAPVSGEIVEVNQPAAEDPALVNADPYGDGWLCKIKLSQPAELDALLSPAAYQAQIGE